MQLQIKVESPSKITRKLTITVPADEVSAHFEKGLIEVQKTANLKGFRPGNAPISMIKKVYGEEVRHKVFHHLIDESFRHAVIKNDIKAIGRPQIDSSGHQHGQGEHDHGIQEGKELTFTATVEILPEIEVKGYTGISLKKDTVEVTDKDADDLIQNLRDSQAQLVPASSGLVGADGGTTSRPVRKGDFVDVTFKGGLVSDDSTVEEKEGMSGTRLVEIGSNSLIPGFEEELEGMRASENKTFRIKFPKDFHDKEFQNREAEFSVTINEVKEKKLPELDDDLAKQVGAENVADLKAKAKESLKRDREQASERKLRSDLFEALISKNSFDCPQALIESQTRALAQDMAQEFRSQKMTDEFIQQAIMEQLDSIKKRAENQVRASLILEAIAKKEDIQVSEDDIQNEMKDMATSMNADVQKVIDYYSQDPARREDLEFRVRQEKTVSYLISQSKVKN